MGGVPLLCYNIFLSAKKGSYENVDDDVNYHCDADVQGDQKQ